MWTNEEAGEDGQISTVTFEEKAGKTLVVMHELYPSKKALDDAIASTIADPADGPELMLEKKDRAELLRHALARLSPEHGEVIDLVYYHHKSVEEVAQIVGVQTSTVKTRMFYARSRLAHMLNKAGIDRAAA